MTPRRTEFPKERKVTARFTADEVERLAREAKRRGAALSSLVRELVVVNIGEIQAKLEERSGR